MKERGMTCCKLFLELPIYTRFKNTNHDFVSFFVVASIQWRECQFHDALHDNDLEKALRKYENDKNQLQQPGLITWVKYKEYCNKSLTIARIHHKLLQL